MLLILIFIGLATYYLFNFYSKVKSLPPGPFPIPLLGNFFQIAWGSYSYGGIIPLMRSWHQKYGKVVTWHMGPLATVNIADYETAVDAMVKKGANFVDRGKVPVMEIVRKNKGVIFSNGQHWLEQRRFALQTLRNFGLGKNLMQDRVMAEYNLRTEILNNEIEEAGGSLNVDLFHFIEVVVGNIMNRILFSEGFTEETQDKFLELKRIMDESFDNTSISDLFVFSNIEWLPFQNALLRKFTDPQYAVIDFIKQQVSTRKVEIESGKHELRDDGQDFVDAFLIQMQKEEAGESFDEETLAMTVLDLWVAGQETTAITLYWAINYLLLNPEVAVKLRTELDDVTGQNRNVELADKPKTPYLNACVLEILRLSKLIPINMWRIAAEDTTVGPYSIPKGTSVTAQMSLIMSDPSNFPDEQKFKPERFLDGNVDQFVVPFGLGKRSCLGESLARAELFLILGNLMLFYNFSLDPEHPPQMRAYQELGSMRKANRYHVVVSKRV